MENTKQIYFEGRAENDDHENPFFTEDIEDKLLAMTHGDHATVKVDKSGYLHSDKSVSFIIGSLTTRSRSGFDVIPFMTTHLHDYTIVSLVEWKEVKVIFDVSDNFEKYLFNSCIKNFSRGRTGRTSWKTTKTTKTTSK